MARPPFKPTKAQREQVTASKALGMSIEKIAMALGIDAKTLMKHFGHEVGVGAAQAQMQARAALFKQAKAGNVSAIKHALTMIDRANAAAEVEAPLPANAKSGPIGKKDAAAAAAHTAGEGSEWGNDLKVEQHRVN